MYNLRNNEIDFDFHPQYVRREIHEGKLSKSRIFPGDLIMNIVGPPLGKLAIAPARFPEANTNQAAVVIRPYAHIIPVEWVRYYLMQMSEINRITTRGSAGQVNISLTQSKMMRIAIPPVQEMMRLLSELDRLLGLVDQIERDQKDLGALLERARRKVLDLAVRGRLVEQDPEDEPASALLERVREEKLRMVAEGRLKPKDVKGDSVIFRGSDNSYYEKVSNEQAVCIDDQIPFDLPTGWAWTRVTTPYEFNPRNSANDSTIVSFADMASIEGGYSGKVAYQRKKWSKVKGGFTHFADDDILFAKISPCFENRKSFIAHGLTNGLGCGTTELFVLRPLPISLYSPYTLLFLKSDTFIRPALRTFMGTVGQQRVKRDYVEQALLPVPPVHEQVRIASAASQLIGLLDFE